MLSFLFEQTLWFRYVRRWLSAHESVSKPELLK